MISAKIICDSVNAQGKRITTFLCTFNRWILAEQNTHRILSKNTASSRAIPLKKMIDAILNNTALPVSYGKNMKGMSANEELDSESIEKVKKLIYRMRNYSISCVRRMETIGLHKQVGNRYLEPFSYTTSIVTGTDWANFFNLRVSNKAQPEFKELAKQMLICYKNSIPKSLKEGEWHLPFGDKFMQDGLSTEQLIKISVARCARVSYLTFDGDIKPEKDYELHDTLIQEGHMSPTEHQAFAMNNTERYGNFCGWKQYRKMIPNENRDYLDSDQLLKDLLK